MRKFVSIVELNRSESKIASAGNLMHVGTSTHRYEMVTSDGKHRMRTRIVRVNAQRFFRKLACLLQRRNVEIENAPPCFLEQAPLVDIDGFIAPDLLTFIHVHL